MDPGGPGPGPGPGPLLLFLFLSNPSIDGRDMTLFRSAGSTWVLRTVVFCALIEVYPSFRVRTLYPEKRHTTGG